MTPSSPNMTTTTTRTSRWLTWRAASRLFLITTSLAALILCPHSKVEESFNLQATHDLYYHGVYPAIFSSENLPYDHLQYPGVVPRTFAGPLLLASACRLLGLILKPIWNVLNHAMMVQFLARFLLLASQLHAWFRLANAVDAKFGIQTGSFLLAITASQFHLPFYASRMLPNVFALVLVIHAYADWFSDKKTRRAAVWLVVATVVFRCDVLLLLCPMGLSFLIRGQLKFWEALKVGLLTVFDSLILTVPLDSLLWQRPVWPEGEVFYFNAILGKSSDWGTSPWHWYISSALPKAMLLTLFLVPLGVLRIPEYVLRTRTPKQPWPPFVDTAVTKYLLPVLGFLFLYSFLGHKEIRFIFPALPMLNVVAAVGLQRLHRMAFPQKDHGEGGVLAKLAYVGGLLAVFATYGASLLFLMVSRHNYPGGTALQLLVQHILSNGYNNSDSSIRVHVDVASAMTGVSLFGQAAAQQATPQIEWDFGKAGYEQEHEVNDYTSFTHMLSEDKDMSGFRVVTVAQGNPRLDIKSANIVTDDAIYVLERGN